MIIKYRNIQRVSRIGDGCLNQTGIFHPGQETVEFLSDDLGANFPGVGDVPEPGETGNQWWVDHGGGLPQPFSDGLCIINVSSPKTVCCDKDTDQPVIQNENWFQVTFSPDPRSCRLSCRTEVRGNLVFRTEPANLFLSGQVTGRLDTVNPGPGMANMNELTEEEYQDLANSCDPGNCQSNRQTSWPTSERVVCQTCCCPAPISGQPLTLFSNVFVPPVDLSRFEGMVNEDVNVPIIGARVREWLVISATETVDQFGDSTDSLFPQPVQICWKHAGFGPDGTPLKYFVTGDTWDVWPEDGGIPHKWHSQTRYRVGNVSHPCGQFLLVPP